jgi:hypothetical protein
MGKNIEILYNLKLFDGNFFRRRNLPPLNNKNFFYVEKLNRLCFTGNPTKAATVTFFGVYIAFVFGTFSHSGDELLYVSPTAWVI